MKFEIPLEIGQEVFFVLREDRQWHEFTCPNCDGTGKVAMSKSVHVECKRCDGHGQLTIENRRYRVVKNKLHGVRISHDSYDRNPEITYAMMRYIRRTDTDLAFAAEHDALEAAKRLNQKIDAEFEQAKAEAATVVSMDYTCQGESDE